MMSPRLTLYPNLPDPLTLKNGKKVTKASDWWSRRRPEIVEDFDREIYRRVPKNVPAVKWMVTKTENGKNGDIEIVTRTLSGVVDNSIDPDIEVKIGLVLVTPANANGPVPVMLLFSGMGFGFPATPQTPGAILLPQVLHMARTGSPLLADLSAAAVCRPWLVEVPVVGRRGLPHSNRFWRVAGDMHY